MTRRRNSRLFSPPVGVDLGYDLLADIAALVEAEGPLEARLLGVDRIVNVLARLSYAHFGAEAVPDDATDRACACADEGLPEA